MCQAILTSLKPPILLNSALLDRSSHCRANSLTLEGDGESIIFPPGRMSTHFLFLFSRVFLVFVCFSCIGLQISKADTRSEETFRTRVGAFGMRTISVKCCTTTGAHIVISICVNEVYTLYEVVRCLLHDNYCYFSILVALL